MINEGGWRIDEETELVEIISNCIKKSKIKKSLDN